LLLFPYAEIEYDNGELSTILQFVGQKTTTEVKISFDIDNDLNDIIEGLLWKHDDGDYQND
jgi:hypothetical protein